MFDFVQYAISVVYVHGTGNVFNVLNSLLQEVALSILLIPLITLFYNIKCLSVYHPSLTPQECYTSNMSENCKVYIS